MSTAAMAAMPRAKSGIASGVLAMTRVLAGAVLLAVGGAVFQARLPSPETESGFAEAVASAFVPGVVVLARGTVLTWLLVRAPTAPGPPAGDPAHHQHHRRFHL